MNTKARQRTIRNFIASMLMSDLNRSELRQVADDLQHGELAFELATLVREASEMLKESPADLRPDRTLARLKDNILEMVTKQKITRKNLGDVILLAAPRLKKLVAVASTTRGLLNKFLDAANEQEIARLGNILNGEFQDAYLKGIVGR
ncbi:hypothetical protein AB8A31_23215 [Tardiphaga sp. 804_B3_N1_9]|uniref:hypothetical protein n=1 Tax=Tardiphaga TaxID=1395974 RepID=UPI001586832C|nr:MULTISPECIES: hypothetical protein [Tardiphaga]NUU43931.1 hypothetical protein [Tardiphaga robiniae]UFS74621.1 hypothetical protein LPB73_22345 [Tardiphaga sp. 37S4]